MTTETEPFEILVAEDSEGGAELVRKTFKQDQIHIVSAGARTIQFTKRIETGPNARSLNLLLFNLRLPICDGGKVLASLRSLKHYRHTPVIVIIGLSSSPVRERASRHHTIPFFEKSSTLEELRQLGSMIGRRFEQEIAKPSHQIIQGGAA